MFCKDSIFLQREAQGNAAKRTAFAADPTFLYVCPWCLDVSLFVVILFKIHVVMLIDYARFTGLLGCATAPECRRRLRSPVRTPLLTDCRRILAARLQEQGYSLTEIGQELHRHPTTILRLVQTHHTLLEGDPTYPRVIEKIFCILQ